MDTIAERLVDLQRRLMSGSVLGDIGGHGQLYYFLWDVLALLLERERRMGPEGRG